MEKLKEVSGKVQIIWQSDDIITSTPLGFLQVIEDDMPKNFCIHLFFDVRLMDKVCLMETFCFLNI